jgi:hypothetical protein
MDPQPHIRKSQRSKWPFSLLPRSEAVAHHRVRTVLSSWDQGREAQILSPKRLVLSSTDMFERARHGRDLAVGPIDPDDVKTRQSCVPNPPTHRGFRKELCSALRVSCRRWLAKRDYDGSGPFLTMCPPCAPMSQRERVPHRPYPDAERSEGSRSSSVFGRRNLHLSLMSRESPCSLQQQQQHLVP